MKVFNKEVIENFTNPISADVSNRIINWLDLSLTESINDIKKITPVITSDYSLLLIGDFLSETTTSVSQLDLFVAFKSPQLELNSIKLSSDRLKQFWLKLKRSYLQVKQEKKSKRRLKREEKKALKNSKKVYEEIPPNKFSILNLKLLLINKMLEKVSNTTKILVTATGFKIIDRENLGIDINLYPVIISENSFKLYDEINGKFTDYNFQKFEENFNNKLEEVGEDFIYMIRVFKNLYFNIFNASYPSKFFVESLIYNIPNELFVANNFYESFIKILNYLSNSTFEDFKLIYDDEQKLFKSKMISENILTVLDLVKKVDEKL